MINTSSYSTEERWKNAPPGLFEDLYISVRKKEGRIYSNKEVALLPHINPSHVHYKEWQVRKRSSERLIKYLRDKRRSLKILEVGSGNGWLSAKISGIENSKVTGIDINILELKQAFEVFGYKHNLSFVYGDIHDKVTSGSYDIIVFAASLQYFSSLNDIIDTALYMLNDGGEIHILDTHFYEDKEIEDGIERTKNYYLELGYGEMAEHYFHHTWKKIKTFNYRVLFKGSIINKLLGKRDPFPWIQIIK